MAEVVSERLAVSKQLQEIAAADADSPMATPEPDDFLSVLTESPLADPPRASASEPVIVRGVATNFIEREARNRSLGSTGEEFVLKYKLARFVHACCESLAHKIEHTSKVRGDHEGCDILSFETNGAERLIEVKTAKYGKETPFFVTRNEVVVSERHPAQYNVHRMFSFRNAPRLYLLPDANGQSCHIISHGLLALLR